jgi:hypothetical protein
VDVPKSPHSNTQPAALNTMGPALLLDFSSLPPSRSELKPSGSFIHVVLSPFSS